MQIIIFGNEGSAKRCAKYFVMIVIAWNNPNTILDLSVKGLAEVSVG
jgi:hypothetical protein